MTLAELLNQADAATKDIDTSSMNTEFKPLPPGEYNVAIVKAEGPIASKRANPMNPNEFGNFINIQLKVTDGEHANRVLFCRNNITVFPKTTSAEDRKKALTAMAIGCTERKVWLASVGKAAIQTAEELVGATCKVSVIVRKNAVSGKDENEVKKIMTLGSASTPAPASSAPAPAAKPAAAKKMPWEV